MVAANCFPGSTDRSVGAYGRKVRQFGELSFSSGGNAGNSRAVRYFDSIRVEIIRCVEAMPDNTTKPRKATKQAAEPAAAKANQRGIQSVETGFAILDVLLRAGTPLPLSRIAEQAQLTVANTHYYLVSFQRVGVVQQDNDTGHYGLGSYALKLGVAALEQFDVYKLARPAMVDISAQTGHTVFLGLWGNKGPTIVYRIEGGRSKPLLELRVGSVLPLLSSALGRNFLAHLPSTVTSSMVEEELAWQQPSGSPDSASATPRSAQEIEAMIGQVREAGYSRCQDVLLPNFTSLSAPIFDLSGGMIAAITVMGPSVLLNQEAELGISQLLKQHAKDISQSAGLYG